jgi:hypothetical protein
MSGKGREGRLRMPLWVKSGQPIIGKTPKGVLYARRIPLIEFAWIIVGFAAKLPNGLKTRMLPKLHAGGSIRRSHKLAAFGAQIDSWTDLTGPWAGRASPRNFSRNRLFPARPNPRYKDGT